MKIFISLILTMGLIACGSSSDDDTTTATLFDSLEYTTLNSDASIATQGQNLVGSGSLLFRNAIASSVTGGGHIQLGFSLEDGGSLALVSFANTSLASGIQLTFLRSGNELSLKVGQGDSAVDFGALSGVDATGEVAFRIDVHNDESPAHVIVWEAAEDVTVTGENQILDSEEIEALGSGLTPGSGVSWGLVLSSATLSHVALGEPQLED